MKKNLFRISFASILCITLLLNIGNVIADKNSRDLNYNTESNTKLTKLPGDPAPGFTLTDQTGKKVALDDFKGKVVYMDIWASWCAPCLFQMKKAESLKQYFKNNDDVVFLYVSIDNNEAKWKKTIEKRKIDGVHLLSRNGEEESIVSRYNVPSIPRFVLIDKHGKIADFNAKAPSNNSLIQDIEKLL